MSSIRKFALGAVALAALGMAPLAASAATIINGGFENGGTPPDGGFVTVGVSSGVIPGWDVTLGTVDWIRGYWQSSDGDGFSVDMNGDSPGAISQTIATVLGTHYHLTFDISGNPDVGGGTRVILADTGGAASPFVYNFTVGPNSRSNMNWESRALDFVATGSSTTITFASGTLENCCWGAAIDNVGIGAVPEPATWALMLTGFFGAGVALRRRRVAVTA
jgi:choice-of-anchor C domain-containing protein